MYRAILVPLDGSELSERAIAPAAGIARRSDATLHFAHALAHATADPIYSPNVPVVDAELHSHARDHVSAYLARLRAGTQRMPRSSIVTAVVDAAPDIAAALAHYAAVESIDLVVMMTHGRSGIARAWLGSVADRLSRISPAPVLLIRAGEPFAPPLSEGRFSRIIVPLDGSAAAEAALRHAMRLGELAGASYTLLHVLAAEADDPPRRELAARHYLLPFAARLRAAGHQVDVRVVHADTPAQAIVRAAESAGADLIALAANGSGGAHLFLGSVADKIVRGATAPVLICPTPRHVRGTSVVEAAAYSPPLPALGST
jgi:nucleotide-binding universal stress UspA family protein